MQNTHSVTVKTHWIMKVFSVIGVLFFGFIAFVSLQAGESLGTIAVFVLFAIGSFYLWFLASSFIAISDKKVMVAVPSGRYQIGWNEITAIETNGKMYAFIGQDKRVVISLTLASRASQQALELVKEQCKQRNLEIQNSMTVHLTHLNSKVK